MIVLSRKQNESIIINDDITIVVVEIRGDKVRLGVEAPKEMFVHRGEVYQAIRGSKEDRTRSLIQDLQRQIRELESQNEMTQNRIQELQRKVSELQSQSTH
jgi:carbon storage regulator